MDNKDRGIVVRGGKLYIDVSTQAGRYKKATGLEDTLANRKIVRGMLVEIRAQNVLGKFSKPDSPTKLFGEFALTWMQAQSHLATSTWSSYRGYLNNYILPYLGNRNIADITITEVSAALSATEWSNQKTRNKCLVILKMLFSAAVGDKLITESPAASIKFSKTISKEPMPLTADEVEMVLDSVKIGWRHYFEVAFFTGLRTSELLAIRRVDIDEKRMLLRVERAKVAGETKGTKTGSTRYVELSHRALSALLDCPGDDVLLIDPKTDKPIRSQHAPWQAWADALDECGLDHRAAYQTRHTYATMYLMAGANPAWIARQLGHANMGMLLQTYGRWISFADNGKEASRLDVIASQKRPKAA